MIWTSASLMLLGLIVSVYGFATGNFTLGWLSFSLSFSFGVPGFLLNRNVGVNLLVVRKQEVKAKDNETSRKR